MENVRWLPEKTNALLADTVAALQRAMGDELVCACLVGAAMNPARGDRARAPEVLVVVAHGKKIALVQLSEVLAPVMKRGARVRVVTEHEVHRSLDVFALETAEWKARHCLLVGRDVLSDLEISAKDLRFSIELELRGLVRRIRNRLLAGLATDNRRDDPMEAIVAGYDRLVVVAYHVLALDGAPPAEEAAILDALGARLSFDTSAFVAQLESLRRGDAKVSALSAFDALLGVTERLIDLVDRHELGEASRRGSSSAPAGDEVPA